MLEVGYVGVVIATWALARKRDNKVQQGKAWVHCFGGERWGCGGGGGLMGWEGGAGYADGIHDGFSRPNGASREAVL